MNLQLGMQINQKMKNIESHFSHHSKQISGSERAPFGKIKRNFDQSRPAYTLACTVLLGPTFWIFGFFAHHGSNQILTTDTRGKNFHTQTFTIPGRSSDRRQTRNMPLLVSGVCFFFPVGSKGKMLNGRD